MGLQPTPIGSLLVRSVLPWAVVADRTDGSEARHEAGAKESQIRAATTAKRHRSAEAALLPFGASWTRLLPSTGSFMDFLTLPTRSGEHQAHVWVESAFPAD